MRMLFPYHDLKYAHVFRRDGLNHVVATDKANVKRNGRFRVICGPRIDQSFQRRVSSGTVIAPVTCPTCLSAMTALHDFAEAQAEAIERGEL